MRASFEDVLGAYNARGRRTRLICAGLAVSIVLIMIAAITISQYHMTFGEACSVLIDHIHGATYDRSEDYDAWFKDYVIWDQNLPRFIAGVMIGAVLAIGGTIMQAIIKNPLADPYTTGISSGALFGVSLYIVLGITLPLDIAGDMARVAMAFVFSLIPVALIIAVTVLHKRTLSPTAMILVGIGAMYMFSAGSALMRFYAEPFVAQEVYEWTLGSLGKVGWDGLPVILAALVGIVLFSIVYGKNMDVVSEGDEAAIALGVNPKRVRVVSLIVISLCTAAVVCYSGTIGFIGLICPHIGRILVSTSFKHLLPASALIGAVLLAFSDCVAKVITPTGLPVGVITALIGSPILVYILIRQRKEAW